MTQESTPPRASIPAYLPNALTVLRLVLVPVFLVLLFVAPSDLGWRLAATLAFGVAILTDFFDGRLARKYNLVSDFGKIWDPIADKALTGAAFIGLSILQELPWWITILILAREWGITWMRVVMLKYGVMAAAAGGKLKTLLQAFALLMFLPGLSHLPVFGQWLAWLLMGSAFVLTIVTGGMYVMDAWKLKAQALSEKDTGNASDS
jgi:CDP-diacylglycerol--glycerol-3-phosphate 3-phosphatidyltransferase